MGASKEKLIWLIILFGLALRVISLDQSLWLDEAINTLAVKNYSFFDLITQYARADFHPPGWFIILWFWTRVFGYSEIAVRVPSVIFGILTVYITYLIGRKLVSIHLGLISALLLAINPLHIYYSQEARMYALATLAVAMNILLFIKILKGERLHLILLILSNIFVLASDYIAYFIFPAQLIFLIILQKREVLKRWGMAFILAIASGIWWLPTFLGQLDVGSVASANLPAWKFIVGGFDFKTLPLTFVKFIIGRISLADKIIYAAVLLPVCSLFIFLLFRAVKYLDNFNRKLLIIWVIVPLLIATVISTFIPVYNYFRVLFVLPSFVILIASGLLSFKGKVRYVFLIIVVLIEFFCSFIYLLNPVFQREDWKGVVSFLNKEQQSIILFESSGTLPSFDYYAQNNLNAKGALKDFPAKDESAVSGLENLLEDTKDIYLVDYLVQISDPNRLVAKKLVNLGYEQVDVKNFSGVGFVYHYIKDE